MHTFFRFKTIQSEHARMFFGLCYFYLSAHFGAFWLLNAKFWDDYTLKKDLVISVFAESGALFNLTGYFHFSMLHTAVWSYHALSIIVLLLCGLTFKSICNQNSELKGISFLICLLFLVAPIYSARVTMIMLPSSIFFLLFLYAWNIANERLFLASILFLISFTLSSLVFLYPMAVLMILYNQKAFQGLNLFYQGLLRNFILLVLPPLWYWIKVSFYSQHGLFEHYNEVDLKPVSFFIGEFLRIFMNLFDQRISKWVLLVSFFFAVPVFIFSERLLRKKASLTDGLKIITFGFVCFLLGAFPYLLVGKTPLFEDWDARHQILMLVGMPIFFAGVLSSLPFLISRVMLFILVLISIGLNIDGYTSLSKDYEKHQGLKSFFATSKQVSEAPVIVIEDEVPNAFSRRIRFYEYNALLAEVYGKQDKFGLPVDLFNRYKNGQYDKFFLPRYSAASHERSALPRYARVIISLGENGDLDYRIAD